MQAVQNVTVEIQDFEARFSAQLCSGQRPKLSQKGVRFVVFGRPKAENVIRGLIRHYLVSQNFYSLIRIQKSLIRIQTLCGAAVEVLNVRVEPSEDVTVIRKCPVSPS